MTLESRQAYRKIMDAVTVTPEVERRVLAGLRTALETGQKPALRRWQPRLAACAALVICAAAGFPLWLDSRTPAETPPVQVTWSAQQFESTGELAEQLSYPLLLPAWLPEGYELLGTQFDEMSSYTYFGVLLGRGESRLTISYQLYLEDKPDIAYQKDEGVPEEYVAGGQLHYIMTNAGKYLCVWVNDHVECFIAGADSREELIKIIDSIYMEGD